MKIALICDSGTAVNILPDLADKLKEEILDIKCTIDYVPSKLDIPFKVQQLAPKADLLFVFALYAKKDHEVSILCDKLVDLEIELKKQIIKAIEESELEELDNQAELEEERQKLIMKWKDFIVRYLKKPESFAPQYFSKESEPEFASFR